MVVAGIFMGSGDTAGPDPCIEDRASDPALEPGFEEQVAILESRCADDVRYPIFSAWSGECEQGGFDVLHWSGGLTNWQRLYDPATGEVARRVALAGSAEVDAAVASARDAFDTWRRTPVTRRAQILFRMREILDRNDLKAEDLRAFVGHQANLVMLNSDPRA